MFKKRYNYIFSKEKHYNLVAHSTELPNLNNFTNEELVDLVLKDVFGKGSVRKMMLGKRWQEVQKMINAKEQTNVQTRNRN